MCNYCVAADLDEAFKVLASCPGKGRVIAGGTDLMVDLNKGRRQADVLVDITHIPGLAQIQINNNCVEIGAAVTFKMMRDCKFFQQYIPMLTEAASSVGAPAIQTSATWVGNLVQAMPAADGAIIALALEAEVCVVESGKVEWRSVSSLFAGPGISTIDSSRQIVTHLRFNLPTGSWGTAWQRIGRRAALTLPTINCATKIELACEHIQRATIALGPVASTPFRAHQAEAFLAGQPPSEVVFSEAARLAQVESNPRGNPLRASREYRLTIIPVLVHRALSIALERANK